jgi:hypothetical protein
MHDEFCMVSDRPEILKVDEQHRPHCGDGPSHRWRDGWELFYWHGVKIPGEWVTGKPPTAKEALAQENAELRRAACEIVGWHKVLESPELNPRIIDVDEPYIGTLIQVDLPDAPEQWFLKYQCGTGRWFAESVNDKSFDTALKATGGAVMATR